MCQKIGGGYLAGCSQWIPLWSRCHSGGLLLGKVSSQGSSIAWLHGMPFWQHWIVLNFVPPNIVSPILGKNMALRLHYWSRVDTWWRLRVHPESIIVTWGLGDTYYTLYLNLPLGCLYLLNSQYSMGPDGVIWSCPDKEFTWQSTPYLLPNDKHWFSCPGFSISLGTTLAFAVNYISSAFWPLDLWVSAR